MLKRFLQVVLDYLFPYRCIGCGNLGNFVLCHQCYRRVLTTAPQCCPVCGCSADHGTPCVPCRSETSLDFLMIASRDTTGIVRRCIHYFKYRFIDQLHLPLSGLMLNTFLQSVLTNENLVLVPVPLHPSRERWRGFNQSLLLARSIGNIADIAVAVRLLRRIRKTPPQVTQSRSARLKNLHHAFDCITQIPPHKEIVLIDDVATTRATLEACARILKNKGARRVGALVLSRGT